MKTTTLFAALALSLATGGAAFAQEIIAEPAQTFTSQKTRAQVQAELVQARAEGKLYHGEVQPERREPFISTVTRAQVRAETLTASVSGELGDLHHEYTGRKPELRRAVAPVVMAGK